MVDWSRFGRGMQVAGIGLITVFFVATAVAAGPLHGAASADPPAELTVGAMGAGADGSVTHYESGSQVWQFQGAVSYNAVQRLNESHILVTSQSDGEFCSEDMSKECDITGVKIIDTTEAEPHIVWGWTFEVRTGRNSEVHDAEMLPNGNILVADMDNERIVEVDRETRDVVWSWHASEFYRAPDNVGTRDWLHLNDVDRIGDGRYLVSIRNANQLLVIERGEGVVEVINEDRSESNDGDCKRPGQLEPDESGDVRCGDPDILGHQHNPQWLGDGAVLVADSENDRIVELHRSNGTWEPTWVSYSANGVPYDWPRDADRLPNGQTLVTDTRNARAVAIWPNGSIAWSQSVPEQAYEADIGNEYPAGAPSDLSRTLGQGVSQPFPGVERLYGAIRWAVPLPHWVTSWHLLISLVGGLLAVYGTVARQFGSGGDIDESESEEEVSASA